MPVNKEEIEINALLDKYPYIVANGKRNGSSKSEIVNSVRKAEAEKQPVNTTMYSRIKRKWLTTDDFPSKVLADLRLYISGKKGGPLI